MILGLFTELLAAGGIQRVGRHTIAVLAGFAQDQRLSCRLLSLNDPTGHHKVQIGDLAFIIRGFGRRKIRFVLAVLAVAPRVRLTYMGHPNFAPLGLLIRLLRPSARYFVAAYGIDVWEPLPRLCRVGLRLSYSVTAPSWFTAEKITEVQRISCRKVKVIPLGLDPDFLTAREGVVHSKPAFPSGRMLLTVARLAASDRYKGIEIVIQALPTVLKVVPDTYYMIVGDGDDRFRLECLAKDVGVADHVLFAGPKTDSQLASYYEACDIFVMPSRGEGFGIVFVEAMAFGKPAIGGRHGGTPEVVIDGVTGFLVEYGDVEALAHRLIRLLQDEELCKRMGEAGRRRFEENYTFEHFRNQLTQRLSRQS